MGGQQFARDSICIDTRELDRVVSFDRERGLLKAEAGIQWPKLIRAYLDAQADETKQWGIAQKQTGADTFTLGGSLSSNVHGRGLRMKPLISNIESFTLITLDGKSVHCSREDNNELFRLAIGGYGLFGHRDASARAAAKIAARSGNNSRERSAKTIPRAHRAKVSLRRFSVFSR
jgi:FAD/FMN-containing dehydrogenase